MRFFTTIENGRIDFLLRRAYRGIRRDLDFVRGRLVEGRPPVDAIPADVLPFEILFQLAICHGASLQIRTAYPTIASQIEEILSLYVFREDASVADSLMATRRVYALFSTRAADSDSQADQTEQGEEGEGDASAAAADPETGQAAQRQRLDAREDPFSYWSNGQTQEAIGEQDILSQINRAESAEHDLEKGDRAFYYDEWDRELGDHRTRWCRVIERGG